MRDNPLRISHIHPPLLVRHSGKAHQEFLSKYWTEWHDQWLVWTALKIPTEWYIERAIWLAGWQAMLGMHPISNAQTIGICSHGPLMSNSAVLQLLCMKYLKFSLLILIKIVLES